MIWFALPLALAMGQQARADFDHNHAALTAVLKAHVVDHGASTQVRYAALKAKPEELSRYLGQVSQVTKKDFSAWSRAEQMAFLINAYNGFTLKLIIDHYPVTSIKKIGGWFGNPWKIKFFKLLGEDASLDQIEHQKLRPNYHDPRVHFAINCASIGCPRLRAEAYTAASLDHQLDDQARIFLRDTRRNLIQPEHQTVSLSKIFDWFADDFKPSVLAFAAPYLSDEVKLRQNILKFKLKFTNYDWNLNDVPH